VFLALETGRVFLDGTRPTLTAVLLNVTAVASGLRPRRLEITRGGAIQGRAS
jgi:hypothetical protein